MFGFKEMSKIVSEFGNCAAGITGAYETPAKAANDSTTLSDDKIEDKKPMDIKKMLARMKARRGE